MKDKCCDDVCPDVKPQEHYTENCMICGGELDYLSNGLELKCQLCGKQERGYIKCREGHYVCDDCHGGSAFEIVKEIAFRSQSKDPLEIAEKMMDDEHIPMLGCEHSYLAAAAFLRALQNDGTLNIADEQILDAMRRADKISIAGYCGLAGTCGVACGIASAFSVILRTTCATDKEMSMTFRVMASVTEALANVSGPCCCERFTRTAIQVAASLAKAYFDVDLMLNHQHAVCHHMRRLKGGSHPCKGITCPYFPNRRSKEQA